MLSQNTKAPTQPHDDYILLQEKNDWMLQSWGADSIDFLALELLSNAIDDEIDPYLETIFADKKTNVTHY